MINKIELADKDISIFKFDNFELILNEDNINYILCQNGYFPVDGLISFIKIEDNNYIIKNEDNDKFVISNEDFEKIKEIYLKF
jgi:hypothetical protein